MKRAKKAKTVKKPLFWLDHVPVEDRKDFLRAEEEYTREELTAFYAATSDEVRENNRQLVLNKRQIFLKKYMNNTIEIKNSIELSIFQKFYKWIKV